jgi:hypothetical protein
MATHDYVIDNQTAPNFRADLNNALLAIVSNNSNATAPTVTYANMMWYNTAANILYMRNEDNDAWIALGTLNQTADTFAAAVALASQAEAEAGTDNTKVMTPLRVEQNFAANEQQIGVGQTWSTPSRSVSVSYQNTTGRPIMIGIRGQNSNTVQVSTNNSTWVTVGTLRSASGVSMTHISAIIPNNHYYRLNGGSFDEWAELR